MASSGMKLGREDYKKKKELEEFRKLGAAPAEVDDDGFSINPHIPQYMAEAPWYLSNGRPGLRHQRLNKDISKLAKVGDIIAKGNKYDDDGHLIRNKKWVKGACENCGASTHKTKECVYRPRKHKAKHVPVNIAPEEHIIADTEYTYDGKRDRWNNYNIAKHQLIIARHDKIAQERRQKKAAELDKQILSNTVESKKKIKKLKQKAKAKKSNKNPKNNNKSEKGNEDSSDMSSDSDSDDSDDSDLDSDDDMRDRGQVLQRFDSKCRQTVRNLRIREDLPKYLRNLSTKSAYYDPKTRSMRANPYQGTDIKDELYTGDNFIRSTGDAETFDSLNRFAWQSGRVNGQKSAAIHLQSNPTMTEKAFREFKNKKVSVEDRFTESLTAKYGGAKHVLSAGNKRLIYGQSEAYREFGADGRVIKGQKEWIAQSKYSEDARRGNHASVWGSYYDLDKGLWGYQCCHCTTVNAYCTGSEGVSAAQNKIRKSAKGSESESESESGESVRGVIGAMPKPKEMIDRDKLVNPSGYISTRGIMAAKGIARKGRKAELERARVRKLKKRAKKKRRKKRQREMETESGYGAEKEMEEECGMPQRKKVRFEDETKES